MTESDQETPREPFPPNGEQARRELAKAGSIALRRHLLVCPVCMDCDNELCVTGRRLAEVYL